MSTSFEIRELPTRWQEAIELVSKGTEVLLVDAGAPLAKLVPFTSPRVAGLHPGAVVPAADFDAPLGDSFWAGAP